MDFNILSSQVFKMQESRSYYNHWFWSKVFTY